MDTKRTKRPPAKQRRPLVAPPPPASTEPEPPRPVHVDDGEGIDESPRGNAPPDE